MVGKTKLIFSALAGKKCVVLVAFAASGHFQCLFHHSMGPPCGFGIEKMHYRPILSFLPHSWQNILTQHLIIIPHAYIWLPVPGWKFEAPSVMIIWHLFPLCPCLATWRMQWWTWTMVTPWQETTWPPCWPRSDRNSSPSCSRSPTARSTRGRGAWWWCCRVSSTTSPSSKVWCRAAVSS